MMLKNKLLRRMFGCKREEATGGKRKLHNQELLNLYTLPNAIKMV
jgi:hypothetical protein